MGPFLVPGSWFLACCRNLFAPPRACGHLKETCRADSTQRPQRPPRAPSPEGPVASAAALREIEPPRFRGRVAAIFSSPRACGHLEETCRADSTQRPQRPPRAPNPKGPVSSAAALREIEPSRFRGRVAAIFSSPRACGHLEETCRADSTQRPQRPPRAANPEGSAACAASAAWGRTAEVSRAGRNPKPEGG